MRTGVNRRYLCNKYKNIISENDDLVDVFVTCGRQLAHDAFRVAQSLEPAFISCWIGQVKTLPVV